MASKRTTKTRAKAAAPAAKRSTSRPKAPRARTQPKTLALRSVGPSFTVNDVEKSLAWYRDVLGFAVKDRWEEEGKLLGSRCWLAASFSCSGRTTGRRAATA